MAINKALFSSSREDWATPDDFFQKLNEEFHFDLDPCAGEENHKCKNYFTKEQNGLLQDWGVLRVLQSAIWSKINRRLDRKVLQGKPEAGNNGRYAYTGQNRHDRFPQIHIS